MDHVSSRASLRGRALVPAFACAFLAINVAGWIWVGRTPVAASGDGAMSALDVAMVLPTVDLASADELIVVFGGPVLAAGGEFPEVSEAPFRLEPPLAGRWEWSGTDRLSFLPAEPLGFDTRLVLTPTPGLESMAGRPVAPGMEVVFETEAVRMESAALESCTEGRVVAALHFNGPVDGRTLASRLVVAGGSPFEVLGAGGEQTSHRISIPRGRAAGQGLSIGFDDQEATVLGLPQRFTVVSSEAHPARDRHAGTVSIRFSRTPDTGQDLPPVRVRPDVGEVRTRFSRGALVLDAAFLAGETYRVTVPGALLAEDGATLGTDRALDVAIPRRRPRLSLRSTDGVLTPGGNLALELVTCGIRQVRVRASEVLPGNLVEHLRGARSRYTSREEVVRTYDLTPGEGPEDRHVIDLSALLAETPGGVLGTYRIEVEDAAYRWRDDQVTLRVTDMGVLAKRSSDGVHVWVRSLTGGAPIEGLR